MFTSARDGECTGIDLTLAEWDAINKSANDRNETLRTWLSRIVSETLGEPTPAPIQTNIPISSTTRFVNMETSVYRTVSLLRMFSKKLGINIQSEGGYLADCEAGGLWIIAGECAENLRDHWAAALDEIRLLEQSEKLLNCPAATALILDVEKAVTLLNTMAETIADYQSEDDDAAARLRGEIPTVGPSGYICLAHDVAKELERDFNAGFNAWQQLEREIKEQATAREARRAA